MQFETLHYGLGLFDVFQGYDLDECLAHALNEVAKGTHYVPGGIPCPKGLTLKGHHK